MDDANQRDPQKGGSGIVAECLKKALCLLEVMQAFRSFRKCEIFLLLKRDLTKVYNHPLLFLNLYNTCIDTNP